LNQRNVSKKFIDAKHWRFACSKFLRSPWQYYIKPCGQYSQSEWEYFKRAFSLVYEKAWGHKLFSPHRTKLTLDRILQINSILLTGKPLVSRILTYQVIYPLRPSHHIRQVFKESSLRYLNQDGLNIRVEGFWPVEKNSIDLFCARRKLKDAIQAGSQGECLVWSRAVRKILYRHVPSGSKLVAIYFLMGPEDRAAQAKYILQWYNREVDRILKTYCPKDESYRMAVLELAVKMQRYIDITHLGPNGSGRTSKLVQDYICLQFGIRPPDQVLFRFAGRYWENGTYLPLDKALEMARRGSANIQAGVP